MSNQHTDPELTLWAVGDGGSAEAQRYTRIVNKHPGEHYDQGALYVSVHYEPHGVCAAIVPFHGPQVHTGCKVAPAIAAGNTTVLKPSEQAPLTLMRIMDLVSEILPKNVV
ncbi:hypothetical protein N7470_004421 [Penicillium chermesinum]|nr:hypothetical protein N7470_004421 [Penicillium chermesinum]